VPLLQVEDDEMTDGTNKADEEEGDLRLVFV
jgi:hypothetical protein